MGGCHEFTEAGEPFEPESGFYYGGAGKITDIECGL